MKRFSSILVVFVLVVSLLLAGCPSRKSLEAAQGASAKLATYANAGVNVTRDLWREGVITLEQKDRIADAFIALADAGIAFDRVVASAIDHHGQTPPKSEIERIFNVFDSEVVAKLLAVMSALKLIANGEIYAAVIDSLKAAVLIVAGAFGRRAQIEARL